MTYGVLEKSLDAEPIIQLVYDEITARRIMTKLKMSGMNNDATDPAERNKNASMRRYNNTYETAVKGLNRLLDEHEGKKLRKELHNWAMILHKDGKRMLWSHSRSRWQEAQAYLDFSKSIIEAFKKLPKA